MTQPIIWTPYVFEKSWSFQIFLDINFGKEMIQTSISPETQDKFNKMSEEWLSMMGYKKREPYSFYENTPLITRIEIFQGDVSLNLDQKNLENLLERNHDPMEFNSQNVTSGKDHSILNYMFSMWIKYSDSLKSFSSQEY